MIKNIFKTKIVAIISAITLILGQLNLCLAAPESKYSDILLKQLAAISKQTQDEKTFPEIISLTENSVKVMQQEYFKINENYTDSVLGEKLKQVTEYLSEIAQNNANIYDSQLKTLEQQQRELSDNKAKEYALMSEKIKEMNDLLIETNGIWIRRTQLEKDREDAQKKLDKADANSFWQGFATGISLGIYQPDFKAISRNIGRLENEVRLLDKERDLLKNKLGDLRNKVETSKEEITFYERQIDEYCEQINAVRLKKLQYSEMALFFGTTAATFKYTDSCVRAIFEELASVRIQYENMPK